MRTSSQGTEVHDSFTARRSAPWPRAVVFDCDGLLVDTQPAWDRAYRAIAAAQGHELDLTALGLRGASVHQAADELTRVLGTPVAADLVTQTLLKTSRDALVFSEPGARWLVASLVDHMPLAVASNGPRELVEESLRQTGLRPFFTAVVTVSDVADGKPAPDVYKEACGRIGVDPSDAVAIEDSARGAQAAQAAGMLVVAVPSGGDRFDADLRVRRLDSPQLLEFLQLDRDAVSAALESRGPLELESVLRAILAAPQQDDDDGCDMLRLAADVRACYAVWKSSTRRGDLR